MKTYINVNSVKQGTINENANIFEKEPMKRDVNNVNGYVNSAIKRENSHDMKVDTYLGSGTSRSNETCLENAGAILNILFSSPQNFQVHSKP